MTFASSNGQSIHLVKEGNPFKTLGDEGIKREFTREHIRRLHQWFDADGNFRHPGAPPSSRERLWNCFSLLQGDARSVRLANRIIRRTPIDGNHFLPITAAEVALRYPDRLTAAARAHLIAAIDRHYVNMLEWRYGTKGMHNFVCMTTWFLLAAPCLLDRFKLDHEFAAIPEVYSS
ncbi:MAG: hypothetical protein HY360_06655, partial [Verrucomicrobia bacterium]|nr:hypothetical protein [Verrucomicrobiota bacterium]